MKRSARLDALAIGGVVTIWGASLLLIHPVGAFPLNDDWSYSRAVKTLIETGDFKPTGWTSMPLLTNVVWGALFCLPAGFSFNALRLSTLTLSLLGLVATYVLIRQGSESRTLAAVCALTLAFNPVYYALSNTFMTDVPGAVLTFIAAVFLLRDLHRPSLVDLALGVVVAVAATLSRQLAVSLPIAYAITLTFRHGVTRQTLWRGAAPVVACVLALITFQRALTATGRMPASYDVKTARLLRVLADPVETAPHVARSVTEAAIYLGWFTAPLLIPAIALLWRQQRRRTSICLSASLSAVGISYAVFAIKDLVRFGYLPLMPLARNIITPNGFGPLMLRDTYVLQLKHVAPLPQALWVAVTALGVGFAACLLTVIGLRVVGAAKAWRAGAISEAHIGLVFAVLASVIYLAPIMVTGFFDRYSIAIVPFLLAAVSASPGVVTAFDKTARRIATSAAVATALLACATYSVAGTRDYLEWNRVRWQALGTLLDSGAASPGEIDGGFEFNGWYTYRMGYRGSPDKSWWWVQGNEYAITFGPIPGYRVVTAYSYRRWLPPEIGKVFVMRRDTE